jgi:hypothetical protein
MTSGKPWPFTGCDLINVSDHCLACCPFCLGPLIFDDNSFIGKAAFNPPSNTMDIHKSQATVEMWLSMMLSEHLDSYNCNAMTKPFKTRDERHANIVNNSMNMMSKSRLV